MLLLGLIMTLIGAGAMVYTATSLEDSKYRTVYSFCIMIVGIFVIVLAAIA